MSSGNNQQCPAASNETENDLVHAGKLLAALAELRRNGAYCDVFLQVETEAVAETWRSVRVARGEWAHRAVLAAASPCFYDIFCNSSEECQMQVVIIKDVNLETLQTLLENIYSPASLVLTIEEAKALLEAATSLQVGDVRDAASECLERALSDDNVLGIRTFAEQHACGALVAAASQYIHEQSVLKEDEFLAPTPKALAVLLNSDQLAVPDADEPRRPTTSTRVQALNSPVRWQHGFRVFLKYTAFILMIYILGVIAAAMYFAYTSKPLRVPAALLVIGGWEDLDIGSNSVMICHLPCVRWVFGVPLPEPRMDAGAALIDGHIYLVGGVNIGTVSSVRTVFVYDAVTNTWLSGPEMTTPRSYMGVAALDGRLYAVGGWDGSNTLNSVEMLDPSEGVWRLVAPMTTCRGGVSVAALDGRLYAIGGFDGKNLLNSTERYDPIEDRWETVEDMWIELTGAGVAVVGDAIYAVGGSYGLFSIYHSVQRYRVGLGWDTVRSLAESRSHVGVTAHEGLLYAAGGHGKSSSMSTVLVFDPEMNDWSELPSMPARRHSAAAVVVAWPPPLTP